MKQPSPGIGPRVAFIKEAAQSRAETSSTSRVPASQHLRKTLRERTPGTWTAWLATLCPIREECAHMSLCTMLRVLAPETAKTRIERIRSFLVIGCPVSTTAVSGALNKVQAYISPARAGRSGKENMVHSVSELSGVATSGRVSVSPAVSDYRPREERSPRFM